MGVRPRSSRGRGGLAKGARVGRKWGTAHGQWDHPLRPGRGLGAAELTRRAAFVDALQDVSDMENRAQNLFAGGDVDFALCSVRPRMNLDRYSYTRYTVRGVNRSRVCSLCRTCTLSVGTYVGVPARLCRVRGKALAPSTNKLNCVTVACQVIW